RGRRAIDQPLQEKAVLERRIYARVSGQSRGFACSVLHGHAEDERTPGFDQTKQQEQGDGQDQGKFDQRLSTRTSICHVRILCRAIDPPAVPEYSRGCPLGPSDEAIGLAVDWCDNSHAASGGRLTADCPRVALRRSSSGGRGPDIAWRVGGRV